MLIATPILVRRLVASRKNGNAFQSAKRDPECSERIFKGLWISVTCLAADRGSFSWDCNLFAFTATNRTPYLKRSVAILFLALVSAMILPQTATRNHLALAFLAQSPSNSTKTGRSSRGTQDCTATTHGSLVILSQVIVTVTGQSRKFATTIV